MVYFRVSGDDDTMKVVGDKVDGDKGTRLLTERLVDILSLIVGDV